MSVDPRVQSNPLLELWGGVEEDFTKASFEEFRVIPVPLQRIASFVEKWHYSENVNGIITRQCFALYCRGEMIGAMIYGLPGMANAWKPYGEQESDVVELRRLCCIDGTPKNTESFFIGKTLRWMKQNTDFRVVVSYADSNHDHSGTIYQATNFLYLGMSPGGKMLRYKGRLLHDKAIRTCYTDKYGEKRLKPFAQRVKDALATGEAQLINTTGKHIYVYPLHRKERKRFKGKEKQYV